MATRFKISTPFLLLGLILTGFNTADKIADDKKIVQKLYDTVPQDCNRFLPDASQANQPIVQYNPEQVMQSFLKYYFAPWDNPFSSFSLEEMRSGTLRDLQKYQKAPGWGLNKHPLTADFINAIGKNMCMDTFPNCQQPAITICTTDLRTLPCDKPCFTDWVSAGEGYPFDNWQETLLPPYSPVFVLHTSQDSAWHFVVTESHYYGWIQKKDLAYTTAEFMKQWRTKQYLTLLRDEVPIKGNTFAPLARVGQLIPLAPEQHTQDNYQIYTVVKKPNGNADIQVCTISKADAEIMPLPATPNNVAHLANTFMGDPYGWAGMEGYRDCSSILKDIFQSFGIWLPRNSVDQSKASGKYISLEGMSNKQKEAILKEQATPFFSLLWKRGHIVLYIGGRNESDDLYMYNSIWGLRTMQKGKEGRAVIGQVAVMPLNFGEAYSNIKSSILSKAQKLLLLNDRLLNPHQELELYKK